MKTTNIDKIKFDQLKQSIIDYLSKDPSFTDINYEGSNISYLIDALAFMAYNTNVYNAFALNESFIDTAQLRQSVVAHAKLMGYVPISRVSARMLVDMWLDTNAIQADGLPIPHKMTVLKGFEFSVKIVDTIYTFSTDNNYSVYNINNNLRIDNVRLIEGTKVTLSEVYKGKPIELPKNIDTTTITVRVDGEVWNKTDDNAVNLTQNSKVYFVNENYNGFYQVEFGDNTIGKKPEYNSLIEIDCLQSTGEKANAGNATPTIEVKQQLFIDGVDYTPYLRYEVKSIPSGGKEAEGIDSIRKNAINQQFTQNRAISINDYEYIILTKFREFLKATSVWDLNDLPNPKAGDFGKVFISAIPNEYRNRKFLTSYEKNLITENLSTKYTIVTVSPVIVEPVYYIVYHDIVVYYDETKLRDTLSNIETEINVAITNLYDSDIIGFNKILPVSRIQSIVNTVTDAIINNNVNINLGVYFEAIANEEFAYNYALNTGVTPNTLTIDAFNLADDGAGKIVKMVNGSPVEYGSIDYANGNISFTIPVSEMTSDVSGEIKFKPSDEIIKVEKERTFIDGTNTISFVKV